MMDRPTLNSIPPNFEQEYNYVTVMQVRGLTSCKTRFNLPKKCLYQVRDTTVVFHSFDVFELLIVVFHKGLSVFPWSTVFLLFYL